MPAIAPMRGFSQASGNAVDGEEDAATNADLVEILVRPMALRPSSRIVIVMVSGAGMWPPVLILRLLQAREGAAQRPNLTPKFLSIQV